MHQIGPYAHGVGLLEPSHAGAHTLLQGELVGEGGGVHGFSPQPPQLCPRDYGSEGLDEHAVSGPFAASPDGAGNYRSAVHTIIARCLCCSGAACASVT